MLQITPSDTIVFQKNNENELFGNVHILNISKRPVTYKVKELCNWRRSYKSHYDSMPKPHTAEQMSAAMWRENIEFKQKISLVVGIARELSCTEKFQHTKKCARHDSCVPKSNNSRPLIVVTRHTLYSNYYGQFWLRCSHSARMITQIFPPTGENNGTRQIPCSSLIRHDLITANSIDQRHRTERPTAAANEQRQISRHEYATARGQSTHHRWDLKPLEGRKCRLTRSGTAST